MVLDTLVSRTRNVALLERYGALLTEHQRGVLDLYVRQDWSVTEIAQHQGTSRAAVHDLIRRATSGLEDADQRLGLLEADRGRHRVLTMVSTELDGLKRRVKALETQLGRL